MQLASLTSNSHTSIHTTHSTVQQYKLQPYRKSTTLRLQLGMKITVHSSKAVKPDYGSRPAPATDEVIPLTVLDEANFDTYISVIYAFHPPSPPNAALEAGLARCLAEYREWAGRLITTGASGGRGIVLNDAGARFVEATADAALGSAMPLEPTPDVLALHPCVGEDEPEPELMLIQATRFACGSLVVGFTTQHIVSDGRATGNFFVAWSQAVRGVPIDPAPVHGRASFFSPSSTPASKVQHQHRGVEFKPAPLDNGDNGAAAVREEDQDEVVVSKVHFSRDFISKLKSQASASVGRNQQQRPYSTLQCLVAHLWRGITKARGLLPDEPTSVSIAVDGRARIHTPRPIPEGYTGNVVLWARPTSTAQELTARPVSHAAELINKAVGRIDDGYFRSFVDFAGSGAVEEERLVPAADAKEMVLSPNIEVDSWLRMPFYDVDFGAGRPFFFMPSYLPVEGLLILLPSFLGDGSVDAYVPLFSRHMDTFKSCCHTLE